MSGRRDDHPGSVSGVSIKVDHAAGAVGPDAGRHPVDRSRPALVAVAHGSRDGRSAATMAALARAVREHAPGLDVRLSFLDFNAPRLPDVLAAVAADGHSQAVVVPLLLGAAYHAKVDVPAAVDAAVHRHPRLRIVTSQVLGSAPVRGPWCSSAAYRARAAQPLLDVAFARLREAGADPDDPGLGIVLAGAGSSDPTANAVVAGLAASRPRTVAAFAAGAGPKVDAALASLRDRGATRFAVAPWFLAPGRLLDRVRTTAQAAAPGVVAAEPLGDHPVVAQVLLECYRAAGAETEECADAVG